MIVFSVLIVSLVIFLDWQEFISFSKVIHGLKSNMYCAESLKADGQIGVAIGALRKGLVTIQINIGGNEP